MWANSTTYCVEGTEIPISQALTLDLVIPSCFANSDCVLFWFSLRDFILSAIMLPPLSRSMVQQSKRYYIIAMIIQIDNKKKQSYNYVIMQKKEGIIMDNQNQQMYKAPTGALLIVLVSIISFVNAIVSYIFGLKYVNYGLFGFGAMALHVIQALALLGLGVHFLNKSAGKLALFFNAFVSVISIAFVLFLRSSSSASVIGMMEFDYWLEIGKVISFGTGTSILYIILIISFVLNTFLIKAKKEGDKLTDVRVLTVIQIVSSFWSFFSEDVLGIQFVHIAVYLLLALGLYMCAVCSVKGKFVIASKPISKKSVLRIVLVMVIATLIMIPISFALNDTSPKPIQTTEKECEVCEEEFTDSKNKKYISKTNMCRKCYINYCAMSGKEPENYD